MSIRLKVNLILLVIIIMMGSISLKIYDALSLDIRTYDRILENFLAANKLPGFVQEVYRDVETYQKLPSRELRLRIETNLRMAGDLIQAIQHYTIPGHGDSLSMVEGIAKMIDSVTTHADTAMQLFDRHQVNETLMDSIYLLERAVELSRENVDAYLALELEHAVLLRKEILQKNERLKIVLSGGILAISLSALLLGMYFAHKWVIFPLRHIVASVRNIAAGELDTSVPPGGKDEIGALASDIDTMRASIKEMTEDLKERERLKRIMAQIANVFLTVSDEDLYVKVIEVVLESANSKYGIFGFIETNGNLVIPSLASEVWNKCHVPGKSIVFPPATWGTSLWGRSITEKKVLFSDGPFHTPEGHIHIDNFITAPILFGNEAIGLIAVANKETPYTADDRRLLEMITGFISPILNARLQRDREEQERKTAEEALRRLNAELDQRVLDRTAQLEAANKELEGFTYSVSHDLRAPLRHIDGFLELLDRKMEDVSDEQARHYMKTISGAARKMGQLVDDLLSFSRMGRHAVTAQPLNLGEMVRDILREFESDTAGRNIEWRIGDFPQVGGDAAMLRIVLANLISNALKFTRTRQQTIIEIGSQPGRDTETVIYVRDNGVGFDMIYADKLFGVFQRLHRAEEFEGTGIGLANVRRIIDRHGGRVWAKGKVDHGATFYFALPQIMQESHQ